MRAVATRVLSASVTVDAQDGTGGAADVVGRIDRPGLLALIGVTHTDTADTARAMAGKLHELRILQGDVSCASSGAPLLVVSQFTLYARTDKGRRPSWDLAAPLDRAEPLVDEVIAELRRRGAEVASGRFGAMMRVASVNDGPFTVILEL
ncbi:MAG TPA: D-aminoacyl-tRNA deacylase [Nakamurella sp.]